MKGGEDGKGKRDRGDREDERSGEGQSENKVNSVVRENSGFEINVYHHIISKC